MGSLEVGDGIQRPGGPWHLSIVLPAYDEEDNIVEAVHRAGRVASRLCDDYEIIVVDDGSTDGTARLVRSIAAQDSRVQLVTHDRNRGYGEALRTGFRAARMDLVFFTDADNQFDMHELAKFLPWIDKVDVVAGYRVNRRDTFVRRLFAHMWNVLVRSLFYVPVRDIDCAFKLFRRHVFDSLDLESVGAMVNTELMVKIGRSGAGVVEIGVRHYPRTAGRARGAHPRVIARALVELVRMSRRLNRISAASGSTSVAGAPPVRNTLPPKRPAPATGSVKGHVAVVGGGIAGCATALRLADYGYSVSLLERSPQLGGLLVSFSVGGTPLECFYHHIFPHEQDVIDLITELGLGSQLEWHDSSTGVLTGDRVWPFTSPLDLLRFSPLPLPDRLRAGVGALGMRRVREWRDLDTVPAAEWLRSYCGDRACQVLWDPLLAAKFGPSWQSVPAAWMWGRVHQRSSARQGTGEKLGYLRGGFKSLFDGLDTELRRLGVEVMTNAQVERILVDGDRVGGLETSAGTISADAVVYAGALNGLPRLLPAEACDPRWGQIGWLGVLCVVLELRRSLSDIYWTNVCVPDLPFGGIIEHTNLIPPSDYGDRHIVYLSRYFTPDEDIARADPAEEAARWVQLLGQKLHLSTDDVLAVHPFRAPYAAPLVSLGYLDVLPSIRGPVEGLYLATTAQIYPQDRGMDEGVKAGYRTADVVRDTIRVHRSEARWTSRPPVAV
ncbi:MAG TPA: FAD-dependent oxidoreductase [Acidimicrobiales bacterium]|nr:FAD-dependent oxidoreductase [Acidimicrobiales bacterium]